MDFEELIAAALAVVAPRRLQGRLVGDVGAALLTADGNRYVGVCIDTACGTGFCAENDRRLHFGLGPSAKIEKVEIRWPSGKTQTLDSVTPNQMLTVQEPAS